LLALLVSATAFSADQPRLNIFNAETKDVLGVWDLVTIKSKYPEDKETPPYQRWVFKKDGVMRHIASTKPIEEADMKANDALPPNTRYTVNDSILEMTYNEPPMQVSMRSFIVEKVFPERMKGELEQVGDMILAAYRGGPDEPDVMWILRKRR